MLAVNTFKEGLMVYIEMYSVVHRKEEYSNHTHMYRSINHRSINHRSLTRQMYTKGPPSLKDLLRTGNLVLMYTQRLMVLGGKGVLIL